jgi:hypothetical protein
MLGDCFLLGSCLKIKELAQKSGLLFLAMYILILAKNMGPATFWGDFL